MTSATDRLPCPHLWGGAAIAALVAMARIDCIPPKQGAKPRLRCQLIALAQVPARSAEWNRGENDRNILLDPAASHRRGWPPRAGWRRRNVPYLVRRGTPRIATRASRGDRLGISSRPRRRGYGVPIVPIYRSVDHPQWFARWLTGLQRSWPSSHWGLLSAVVSRRDVTVSFQRPWVPLWGCRSGPHSRRSPRHRPYETAKPRRLESPAP